MSTVTATPIQEAMLLRDDQAGITTLTLNRPQQYNALSRAMLTELQAALDDIAEDSSVRVLVIAANGRAFCAGHDLKEMRSSSEQAFHRDLFTQCSHMMLSIQRLPQPVIARVQGIATAAGCQLVATCDLAVAHEQARFAVSGINVGLFCSTPAVPLSRNLGRKQAMEMLLTGNFIDAPTALQQGLVNQVSNDLDSAIQNLCESICAKSSLAIATGKRLFYRQLEMGLEEAYGLASEAMVCNMDSEDAREGIDAFMGKRQPQWRGC